MSVEESDIVSSDVEDIKGEEFNRDELYESIINQDSQTFAERVMNTYHANPVSKIRETILLVFLFLCLLKK